MGTGKKNQKTTVLITSRCKSLKAPAAGFRKLIKALCSKFKISKATVSLAIVGDTQIREINKQFLGTSGTTDCISFDLSDNRVGKSTKVFDIIVNGQMAARQARQRGHSVEAELALYITHGLLHNIGFEDSTASRAKKMHDAENKFLEQFGYGMVYGNRPKVRKRK